MDFCSGICLCVCVGFFLFLFFCLIGAFVFLNLPVSAKIKFHLKTEFTILNTCDKMLNSGTKKNKHTFKLFLAKL